MPVFKRDCKSFLGTYTCEIMNAEGYKDCEGCDFYEPYSKKILIIKLGAMGDVIRTTPLLKPIKKKYGHNAHITWLVDEASVPLLKNNPDIDKILPYNFQNISRLKYEKFDVLMNLEISPEATVTANTIKAEEKYGYYFNEDSHPSNYNQTAEFYLHRVFSNNISKNNRKTYQEMMAEIAELEYNKEPCTLNNSDEKYAEEFMKKNNLTKEDKIIGINVGSDGRWPSKAWHEERVIELVNKLKELNYKVMLLGGPSEIESLPKLASKVEVITNDPKNTIPQFISIVNLCEAVVTGDSLALHIATALKKKVIALFICTPPWEVEDYNLIKKITSPLFEKHFYTDIHIEELVKSITSDQVLNEIENE